MNKLIKTCLLFGFTLLISQSTKALARDSDSNSYFVKKQNSPGYTVLNPDSSLNIPAPAFTLKDLSGKSVSLSDFKGKVVVLDFWATWCVPCRESFPAMKLVVDKYKNNKDIKFLFIDTREVSKDHEILVKKFLQETGYNFDVLFDEYSKDGKMNKYYLEYIMPGIPTKIFIDKQGIIRAKSIGFKPGQSAEQGAEELNTEIEKLIG